MPAFVAILSAALAFGAEPPVQRDSTPIRVLIVTGEDHPGHLWKETAPTLRAVLEKDKRFQVRIVEDPAFLASEAINAYDVLLLHFKDYAPIAGVEKARVNLANFVKAGKGLVVFHFACGAFEDWPEYAALAGRVWDRKNSHDPRGPFTVRIVKPDHPITREMRDFQADDELYTCLSGDAPVDVLAVARSKVSGQEHPMAMALNYGEGRVFNTPLGHDKKSIEMPGVQELIVRGTLWVAKRDAAK